MNQIKRRKLPPLFSLAATDWLKTRTGIAPATERSYKLAIAQLTRDFGKQLLCDISGEDLAAFQTRREREGVSNRTVNLELGVLRSILRRYRMWEAIAPDVDFLKEGASPGRALTQEEETALLDAASKSRCARLSNESGTNTDEHKGQTGWGGVFRLEVLCDAVAVSRTTFQLKISYKLFVFKHGLGGSGSLRNIGKSAPSRRNSGFTPTPSATHWRPTDSTDAKFSAP